MDNGQRVLALNAGSSSIRFCVYEAVTPLVKTLQGKIDRIGLKGTVLNFGLFGEGHSPCPDLVVPEGASATEFLLDWLDRQPGFKGTGIIGHRIVHGMQHAVPEPVTTEFLSELRRIVPYDPDHLPVEIGLVDACHARYPRIPQLACFDTAFHHDMPRVAKLLPIPRRYEEKGVQRYGFHGLSYAYLLESLIKLNEPAASRGRVILAHLGNGASLAAVLDGKSIDTTMGFTPASGLPMSSRSGDLDPGLVSFLSRTEEMSATQFDRMVNHESGLLGISETSSDIRDLLAMEPKDVRAADAVSLFCYQVTKWIGAFAAVLGGLDILVFAGGIGENSAEIRKRICEKLKFLGIEIDGSLNEANAPLISAKGRGVVVRVIATNEEQMIAGACMERLARLKKSHKNDSLNE